MQLSPSTDKILTAIADDAQFRTTCEKKNDSVETFLVTRNALLRDDHAANNLLKKPFSTRIILVLASF